MAQAELSRGPLGPSILKTRHKKVKICAIPSGNYPPVSGDEASSSSTTHKVQQSVAPTANMIEPQARQNAAALPPNSGKGRSPADEGPADSHIVRLPVRVTEPLEYGEIEGSNGASSLASPPSEPVDTPIITSNVLLGPNLLDPTIQAARRYQLEVDRIERERDREDSSYPGPTPEPEDSPHAPRSGGTRNTPRTRSRAIGSKSASDAPPVMRPELQRLVSGPGRNPAQQKRKAADDSTAESGSGQKRRQYTKRKHNNKRFELLRPASKAERTAVVKSIKSHWKISDDKLMELPFAPRRTTEANHPVLKPLDWNKHLLEALEQLASLTKREFARGCSAAKEAFECRSLFTGATQLTSEIVNVAVKKIRGVDPRREPEQQTTVNAASPNRPIPLQRSAEQRRQPNTASAPNVPLNGHPASAGPSRTSTRAPPSPAGSHTSVPVKIEHAAAGAQSGYPASDEESSGTEERLDLESNRRILELELAIIRERLAADDRRRKEKERKAARLRQHGGSVDDALLL